MAKETASNRGMTILEIMIYCVLVAIVTIPLISVSLVSSRSSAEGSMFVKIQERSRSTLQRLSDEYRSALAGQTTVSANGKVLRFTSDGGFNGTTTVAGPVIRYEIRIDPAETANAKDDNRNGLVDEAIVVRVNETTGQQVTIASALSYQDSSFAVNGTGITLDLTTFGYSHGTNKVSLVQNACTIYPQN